ncbi:MAG: asparaginase domain-containing protein [Saprospiraceae bacterium]
MIQVFATGGTFDKEYDLSSGKLYFSETHLTEMFARGRSTVPIRVTTLFMMDSLDFVEADRELIAHNCLRSDCEQIIITHGTDTIVDTAAYLHAADTADKTIVLTGALIPYAFGLSSDGFFNLGSALAFVQVLPPGIYIVMNGRYFRWDQVRKNKATGYFDEILGKE